MSKRNVKTKTTAELTDKLWIGLVTTMTTNYVENGVPLIRNSDIKPNKIGSELINLDYEFANMHHGRTLKIDDVVTVHTGDVGISAVITKELNGAHGFATINSRLKKDIILPEYYCWFLNSDYFLRQVYQVITGDGRNNLNLNDFVNLKVHYPEPPTQRKIARILSTADAVIEKTKAAIAKYKAIKQGMLHDLFTRGIDLKTNKLRPKYQDAPELYKQSKLGWIPKEWEVERMGNCGTFRKGANIPKYLLSNSGNGCILYGQLYTKFNNVIKNIESKISKEFTKGLLPLDYGDILFAGSGETHEEIGKSAVLLLKDEVYAGGDLIVLSLYEKYFRPFFGYYLNYEPIQRQKAKFGQGSSVIHIYSNHIANLLLSIPPKTEQEKIYNLIDSINSKIQTEQTYLHKLQQIKAGLMADLLSGKKEVNAEEELKN